MITKCSTKLQRTKSAKARSGGRSCNLMDKYQLVLKECHQIKETNKWKFFSLLTKHSHFKLFLALYEWDKKMQERGPIF